MKTERRNGPRLRLAFSVLVDGPFGIRRCVGRDISPGGLFVETADPYAPGTVVRVTFAVPDGSWEMTSRCEVRHTLRLKGPDGMTQGVGLAFLGVDLEADDIVSAARRVHA
ncbi:MAG: PilZ domain-containing protein [Polyangiales bacterium]